ncbi:glycosyltransferase family 39 protein [Thermoleptolyngbya sp. C42_A2020_037]|uniref:glycosyltransferase family 39 protein n=1 Tax=Thermoleptolyngbya sp. C42_A2020_037 TaxID=2747799 RepID=UPI001A0B3DDA|nr:glycosyltransferase family 39 protein [Thermoleptolyngbya sp. C42_A2020_037]MBF2084258.1 glycosyltransferase [Thermoleptolyngbya sp. C42_A2020_037]
MTDRFSTNSTAKLVPEGRSLLWLLGWMLLGLALRFARLSDKAPWTDEFSTMVFSLGNSFRTVPIDRVISLSELMQPLVPNPDAGVGDAVQTLLSESNHPPLYFVLTHLWLQLFSPDGGYVSLWGVRSLSALFGTLTIPAAFGLGWLAFRNRPAAHLAALLMAVSPFGVYLAQEARHYTLPVLWVMASLACLLATVRALQTGKAPALWLCGAWILVNGLGLATHYFVAIALAAEALTLVGLALLQIRQRNFRLGAGWGRVLAVGMGTLLSGLVWLPTIQGTQESELTRWIVRRDRTGLAWLTPLGQLLSGLVSMLYLLPVQAKSQVIAYASVLALVGLALWTAAKLTAGLRLQVQKTPDAVLPLGGVVLSAIALFLLITYGFQRDLTVAFRYQFVVYPAVMVLVAGGLAALWQRGERRVILLVALLGLLGSLTVLANLGFQKTHRPDLLAQRIRENTRFPVLVAIAHRTHGQTGRLMGVAWSWRSQFPDAPEPRFLLAHQESPTAAIAPSILRAVATQPRPLDLWLLNIEIPQRPALLRGLAQQNCTVLDDGTEDGYRLHHLRCEG